MTEQATEQALVLLPEGHSPSEFSMAITHAHEKAKILTEIVEKNELYTPMRNSGKESKHLHVEAWVTIGEAYKIKPATDDRPPEHIYHPVTGDLQGVRAFCTLLDEHGIRCGGATGYCGTDETLWKHKPVFQLEGMAQTRAVSRAFRERLSWVVVLAGYSGTPADEMIKDSPGFNNAKPTIGTDASMGYCTDHNVPFVWKEGISKTTGKPYAFWSCPDKLPDGKFCSVKPDDWLRAELLALGINTKSQLEACLPENTTFQHMKDTTPYAELVEYFRGSVNDENHGDEGANGSPVILKGSAEVIESVEQPQMDYEELDN